MGNVSLQYDFVWWGNGYWVYRNGKYIGKDDQLDLIDIILELGSNDRLGEAIANRYALMEKGLEWFLVNGMPNNYADIEKYLDNYEDL